MKIEIILRLQEFRSSEKIDKYRCAVSEDRAQSVIKQYEDRAQKIVNDLHPYGCWVIANRLTDDGDFVEVYQ